MVEGKDVKSSQVTQMPQTGEYVVHVSFNEAGSMAFEKATQELIGSQMGIHMDETLPLVVWQI